MPQTEFDNNLLAIPSTAVVAENEAEGEQRTETSGLNPLAHFLAFFLLSLASLFYLIKLFQETPSQQYFYSTKVIDDEDGDHAAVVGESTAQGTDLIGPLLFGFPVVPPFMVSYQFSHLV